MARWRRMVAELWLAIEKRDLWRKGEARADLRRKDAKAQRKTQREKNHTPMRRAFDLHLATKPNVNSR